MTDVEKLAKKIMAECEADDEPITLEEAKEMAEMEIKAKGIKNYTQAQVEKKPKAKKEIKLDETKVHIIAMLKTLLEGMKTTDNITDVSIANPQKEITFYIGKDFYSLSLVKHRPPKK